MTEPWGSCTVTTSRVTTLGVKVNCLHSVSGLGEHMPLHQDRSAIPLTWEVLSPRRQVTDRGTISHRKEIPARPAPRLLAKAGESQHRSESRELRGSSGQGRSLLDVIYNLATNPAMSHFVAVEIDPVSRRAIPQASRSAGTAGGEMLAEFCLCRAGGEAAVKFSE